ncbi:MAG TPA: hypothetical protein VIG97_04720 [Luteimonas sp.]
MKQARPARTPYWPDRAALRRRRNARRAFWVAVALVLVLPWFGYRHVRDWMRTDAGVDGNAQVAVAGHTAGAAAGATAADARRTHDAQPAGPSLVASPPAGVESEGGPDSGDTSADVDAIGRDARAGDGAGAAARLADIGAELHRQVLLADRGSAIRREAARRDVAGIPGVRAAGWVDRMTVLLVMSSRGGGHSTIAEACRRLAAHGDVTGLAVRLQEVATDNLAAGAMLGECRPGVASARAPDALQPFPGTPLRSGEGIDPLAPATGTEDAEAAEARRRRAEENLRILSESTPELPVAPQPRADPDAH